MAPRRACRCHSSTPNGVNRAHPCHTDHCPRSATAQQDRRPRSAEPPLSPSAGRDGYKSHCLVVVFLSLQAKCRHPRTVPASTRPTPPYRLQPLLPNEPRPSRVCAASSRSAIVRPSRTSSPPRPLLPSAGRRPSLPTGVADRRGP